MALQDMTFGGGVLYYTDRRARAVYKFDGSQADAIEIATELDDLAGIAVDEVARWVFWTQKWRGVLALTKFDIDTETSESHELPAECSTPSGLSYVPDSSTPTLWIACDKTILRLVVHDTEIISVPGSERISAIAADASQVLFADAGRGYLGGFLLHGSRSFEIVDVHADDSGDFRPVGLMLDASAHTVLVANSADTYAWLSGEDSDCRKGVCNALLEFRGLLDEPTGPAARRLPILPSGRRLLTLSSSPADRGSGAAFSTDPSSPTEEPPPSMRIIPFSANDPADGSLSGYTVAAAEVDGGFTVPLANSSQPKADTPTASSTFTDSTTSTFTDSTTSTFTDSTTSTFTHSTTSTFTDSTASSFTDSTTSTFTHSTTSTFTATFTTSETMSADSSISTFTSTDASYLTTHQTEPIDTTGIGDVPYTILIERTPGTPAEFFTPFGLCRNAQGSKVVELLYISDSADGWIRTTDLSEPSLETLEATVPGNITSPRGLAVVTYDGEEYVVVADFGLKAIMSFPVGDEGMKWEEMAVVRHTLGAPTSITYGANSTSLFWLEPSRDRVVRLNLETGEVSEMESQGAASLRAHRGFLWASVPTDKTILRATIGSDLQPFELFWVYEDSPHNPEVVSGPTNFVWDPLKDTIYFTTDNAYIYTIDTVPNAKLPFMSYPERWEGLGPGPRDDIVVTDIDSYTKEYASYLVWTELPRQGESSIKSARLQSNNEPDTVWSGTVPEPRRIAAEQHAAGGDLPLPAESGGMAKGLKIFLGVVGSIIGLVVIFFCFVICWKKDSRGKYMSLCQSKPVGGDDGLEEILPCESLPYAVQEDAEDV